jgi:hypothetical protein
VLLVVVVNVPNNFKVQLKHVRKFLNCIFPRNCMQSYLYSSPEMGKQLSPISFYRNIVMRSKVHGGPRTKLSLECSQADQRASVLVVSYLLFIARS